MNEAPISSAERVLQTTLQHVRREKSRRRRTRRALAVATALPVLALLSWWSASISRSPEAPGDVLSHVVVHTPEVQDTRTLAVLVVHDGTTTFEQRRANDLADIDLTFSLDPVIARVR